MTMTRNGYRLPPCVVCKIARDNGLRSQVVDGRCRISNVGDVCGFHYHMIQDALTDNGGSST